MYVGVNSGECLAAIIEGCPRLRRLLISHLGLVPLSSYQEKLLSSLRCAQNLKDIRYADVKS